MVSVPMVMINATRVRHVGWALSLATLPCMVANGAGIVATFGTWLSVVFSVLFVLSILVGASALWFGEEIAGIRRDYAQGELVELESEPARVPGLNASSVGVDIGVFSDPGIRSRQLPTISSSWGAATESSRTMTRRERSNAETERVRVVKIES